MRKSYGKVEINKKTLLDGIVDFFEPFLGMKSIPILIGLVILLGMLFLGLGVYFFVV